MAVILGIDIGGSTTKIAAFDGAGVSACLQVKATDQLTSLYGAIGHLLYRQSLSLGDVERVILTGVGASQVQGDVYGIPTTRVKEFEAIGRGGLLLSGLERAMVVSLGTGTAFVAADGQGARHVGGSGVGGGTLVGLASRLLNESDPEVLAALAEQGDLSRVDLSIADISGSEIPSLPFNATAANFGSVKSGVTREDLALGLFNMVYQTVGTLAVFACRSTGDTHIVVTGSLAALSPAGRLLGPVGELYGLNFLIPERPAFATAIGAAALFGEGTPGRI